MSVALIALFYEAMGAFAFAKYRFIGETGGFVFALWKQLFPRRRQCGFVFFIEQIALEQHLRALLRFDFDNPLALAK